jgi:hypothetical protein
MHPSQLTMAQHSGLLTTLETLPQELAEVAKMLIWEVHPLKNSYSGRTISTFTSCMASLVEAVTLPLPAIRMPLLPSHLKSSASSPEAPAD